MKDVPFFPLYAANIIASKAYRLMTLEQRGLWITILTECWVNDGIPESPEEMAKYLGFSEETIIKAKFNLSSFSLKIEGGQIFSTELNEYKIGYMESRRLKSLGGKKGAENKKLKQAIETSARLGNPKGMPEGQPKGSLIQIKSNSFNSNQLTRSEVLTEEQKDWAKGLSDTSGNPNAYAKASRG